MCAMAAKDGSMHHSASRARLHDEMAGNKGASSGVKQMKDKADAGASAGGKTHRPGPTETPIEDHVAEHGPAHGMHYEHDQATNMHHVASFHGDAKMGDMDHPHTHHSVHKHAEAANEHMGKAMGMDHEDEDQEDAADMEETPDSHTDQEAGSHRIPGLMVG